MRLCYGFVLAAQWAWAAGAAPGFSYQFPDPSAAIKAIVVDAAGNTYLTGSTQSSALPATPGAFQTQYGGGECGTFDPGSIINPPPQPCDDAFVVRLDPTGAVVWATYLGGSGQDIGEAIAVDKFGNVYVAGMTSPSGLIAGAVDNFPTTAGSLFPNPSATTPNEEFLVKLNPAGSQMIYGTYMPVSSITLAVDSSGDAYVAAAQEPAMFNFPTTAGAFQTSTSATVTGLVAKLNPAGSALVYATYLGGSAKEDNTQLNAIAVDSSGNAYVTGSAEGDFPVTSGAFQTVSPGGAFVAKLNVAGSGLIYSTFLGTGDEGLVIKLDSLGRAYILGEGTCAPTCPIANSTNFPTTPGAFDPAGAPFPAWVVPTGPGANQFLGSLSADGSSLVYGTYISTLATALDVDASGDAYVAGRAVAGFPVTAGAFEQCYSANAFAAEFNPAGALVAATYFGLSPTLSVGTLAVGQDGLVSIGAEGQQGNFVANLLIDNPQQPDGPCMSLIVENAANYYSAAPSFIAPGELVTLRGVGIGPETGVSASPGTNGLLPTELAGVQVFFDNIAAPLMYVQSQQINVQVPWEIAGRTTAQLSVVYNGTSPNAVSLEVIPAVPGLFYLNYGSGQGAILNSDGSINSPSNPAKAGDVISLFGTGGGPTSPVGVTGGYWGLNTNALLTLPVTVQMGVASAGLVNATVVYAGAAPGLLSGFFQINVQVPPGLASNPAASIEIGVQGGGLDGIWATVAVQ